MGGFECAPVPVEIAYGLERLTMYIQGVDSVYDIIWARGDDGVEFTYGDVYLENEREFSTYNFEVGNTEFCSRPSTSTSARPACAWSTTCRCPPTTGC